jgi:hypothetical protein
LAIFSNLDFKHEAILVSSRNAEPEEKMTS